MSWEAKYLKTRSARPKTHRISPWTMAKTEGDNGKHNGNVEKKRRAMSHIRENNGLNQFCRTHETPTELPWFPAQEMMLYEKPGWCWFYGKITYFRRVCPWFSSVDYHSEASYINWESVCWLHLKKNMLGKYSALPRWIQVSDWKLAQNWSEKICFGFEGKHVDKYGWMASGCSSNLVCGDSLGHEGSKLVLSTVMDLERHSALLPGAV